MFGWFKQQSISELNLGLPLTEARKRARILVIDDHQSAFPVKLLQDEGYNVQYWEKVKNLRSLEEGEFDIIILDIAGISSPEMSRQDGLGVLQHLKKHNPGQIIVAYSGQSFDLGQQKFFQQADDFLGKPSDLLECKQKIDQLLQSKFTAAHYWNTLVDVLKRNDTPVTTIKKFETLFVRKAKQNQPLTAEAIISACKVSKEVGQIIFTLVGFVWKFIKPGP